MGLRQTISEWVTAIKDALDFGPEFPDAMQARRVLFAQESARLQHLLEQTQKASQEKDQLIAGLQTAGAAAGNMVVDGPVYYIKKANALEGPYCTACFQRNHEIVRVASAPRPKGHDGMPADWVQCAKCRTPFRSDRISHYLNPARVPAAGPAPAGVLLQPDKARSESPVSQGTRPDDKRQTTEDGAWRADDSGQKAEPPSHPSAVVHQPPSDRQREPKAPQPQNPVVEGTAATQKDALGTPSPSSNTMPRAEDPKPASAPIAAAAQESKTPKPVKTNRKPRTEPKRGTSRSEKARGRPRETPRWGSPATAEAGPVEEASQPQGSTVESPAPTPDAALKAPRPSRTRSRSRQPKDPPSEKTMRPTAQNPRANS
ncbi:MAG: hypothetical protein M1376_22065 [Planctomycetes bacterium]|nr:hypothetical protein [Planctomycetota bacterium]